MRFPTWYRSESSGSIPIHLPGNRITQSYLKLEFEPIASDSRCGNRHRAVCLLLFVHFQISTPELVRDERRMMRLNADRVGYVTEQQVGMKYVNPRLMEPCSCFMLVPASEALRRVLTWMSFQRVTHWHQRDCGALSASYFPLQIRCHRVIRVATLLSYLFSWRSLYDLCVTDMRLSW